MKVNLVVKEDTGWKNGTLESGVTGNLWHRKLNGVIHVKFQLSYKHNNFFDRVGRIPYYPASEISFVARSDDRGSTNVMISQDGSLIVSSGNGETGKNYSISGYISFII